MKTCPRCKQEKSITEFGINKSRSDGLQAHCKECRRQYQRVWYSQASQLQQERVRASSVKNLAKAQQYVWDYLSGHPCVDCGETDAVVLEFDHRDPKAKTIGICAMLRKGWVIEEALITEIAKCDVRCANCHRRRTANQFNSWKHRLGKANG